jgi:hypothetical protein
MGYLVPPASGVDYARFYVQENEKTALYFEEAEATRNSDDTGLIVFGKCWAISAEYRGKDDATIEKFPHIYLELHDKEWEKVDWKTKEKTKIQPTPIEVFLCNCLMGNHYYSKGDLLDGFKGKLAFGDYGSVIELLPDLPEEKQGVKVAEMIEVETVEVSEEFKAKKKPPIGQGGNKGGYRSTPAQKEAEKLVDRAAFISQFLNSENEAGVFSPNHQEAMALLYPVSEDGAFKQQHYRNYLALILGGNSVL